MASYGLYKESFIASEKGTDWVVQIHKKDASDLIINPNFITNATDWDLDGGSALNFYWDSNKGNAGARCGSAATSLFYQLNSNIATSTAYKVSIKVDDLGSGNSIKVSLNNGAETTITGDGFHEATITSGLGSGKIIVESNGNPCIVTQVSVNATDYVPEYNFDMAGEGFEITWNGSGGTRDKTFIGSECDIKFMVQNDLQESFLYDVLDSGFKEYFVRIYKGSVHQYNKFWYGWIQPAFDVVENAPYPYTSSITATDSAGYYKGKPFKTFADETFKQANYSIANVFKDFIGGSDLAAVNLVENTWFLDGSTRGWEILTGDSGSSADYGKLIIAGTTTTGTRKPLSCEGDVLTVGDKYKVGIEVVDYTSGTLYVKDGGGSSATIGTITNGTGNDGGGLGGWVFEYTQTDNGADGNGLHLWTDNFVGSIGSVYLHSTEDFPHEGESVIFQVQNDWKTSEFDSAIVPSSQWYICKGAFANNSNFPLEYKESDVFQETMKVFNTVGYLADGYYYFLQPNSFFDGGASYNMNYQYFWDYSGVGQVTGYATESNLVTIDQNNHTLLAGSSFTYEAPFKSCTATYSSAGAAFTLAQGDDITDDPSVAGEDYTYGGQLTADTTYDLDWFSRSVDVTLQSDWASFGSYDFRAKWVNFDYYITIKAVSSSATKYLTLNSDQELEWVATEDQVVLSRGFNRNAATYSPYNSLFFDEFNSSSCEGAIKCVGHYYAHQADITRFSNADSKYTFDTDLLWGCVLPQLAETSSIFVKVYFVPRYYKNKARQAAQVCSPISGTPVRNTYVEDITVTARETNSLISNEFRVTEYAPSSSTAIEDFDLGDLTIGVSSANPEFSVTYRDNVPVAENVYRGSDTASGEPFTQFLAKQFLEPQQTPLKILQGSIQSAAISPKDVIKYSYNNDGNYEHFMFMGGTFKGQSEIMDGEWFRLKDD
jgi:hypothetical protein